MRDGHDTLQAALRHEAANDILDCYSVLAAQGRHLLSPLLHGAPVQWVHYPDNDVIDHIHGYQYFYHSHAPEDRPEASEHGHFHLFARIDDGQHSIDLTTERRFSESLRSGSSITTKTIHLLCITLDAKGVPTTLFTVNRWVTGDHFFSAATTLQLLDRFHVDIAEYNLINRWLAAMVRLFWSQIEELLLKRDHNLAQLAEAHCHGSILDDESIEVLASTSIDLNAQIADLLTEESEQQAQLIETREP